MTLLYPRKAGILWITHGHRPRLQRFSCVQLQTTFPLGFLLNFASGLLWQRSGHPIVLVGQESKLGSGESQMSKILTIACVQAVMHSFFRFILYLVHELVGMTSRHPIFLVS